MADVKYLLCPGKVRSHTDSDVHFIGALQLASLYGVRMVECLILPDFDKEDFPGQRAQLYERSGPSGDLIKLTPRYDGNYLLPRPKSGA